MDTKVATRVLGSVLAVDRVAFGANYLARPESAERTWIGRDARKAGTQVMTRSQGARDVALGLGALSAILRRHDREASTWLAAQALADGVDAAATWVAGGRLPTRQRRVALAVAAASTLVAAVSATGLRAATDGSRLAASRARSSLRR